MDSLAGRAKKSTVHVGLVAMPVRLIVAVDEESSDVKVVCTGSEDNPHQPSRIKGSMSCPVCETKHSSHWGFKQRGVEENGGIVVLSPEQLAAAKGKPIDELHLTFHDRAEVYGATVAGDSVQNIIPDKGGEKAYTALLTAMLEFPDVVGVSVYAPSTKNALWVVEVVDGRLVTSKRSWPEDVRKVEEIPRVEVPPAEQAMMNFVVESSVTAFKMDDYLDTARHGVRALVAENAGTAVPIDGTPGLPVGDMFAALQATIDAQQKLAPPKAVKTAKKAAAKRPAKKAAAKRATPARKSA